jgi:hypothetical protein
MNPNQPPQPPPGGQPNQPPPGAVPPQGAVPPGYPPPQGAVPPGYPPPQGAIPPGYPPYYQGYPPPIYMAPPMYITPPVYVPPAAYHVPPSNGQPPEFVPPAEGSVVRAWFSVATNLSRQNYVAWAQRVTRQWATQSVLMAAGLLAVTAIIYSVMIQIIFQSITSAIQSNPNLATSATAIQDATNAMNGYSVFLVISVILTYLAQVFAIPFGQALFMSPSLGSVRQRFLRALQPWVLALVGLQAVGVLVSAILAVILIVVFLPGLHTLIATVSPNGSPSNAVIGDILSSYLSAFTIIFLVGTPAAVYTYGMQIQSGAVGSAMNRWAVFGINLLTSVVISFALSIILSILGAIFFISTFNFTTTTP